MERELNECIGGLFDTEIQRKANATSNIALLFEIRYSPTRTDNEEIDWDYYRTMLPKTLLARVITAEDEEKILKALDGAAGDSAISHNILAVLGKCESKQGLSTLLGVLKRKHELSEKDCDQALFSLVRFHHLFDADFGGAIDSGLMSSFLAQCGKYSPSADYEARLKLLRKVTKGA